MHYPIGDGIQVEQYGERTLSILLLSLLLVFVWVLFLVFFFLFTCMGFMDSWHGNEYSEAWQTAAGWLVGGGAGGRREIIQKGTI